MARRISRPPRLKRSRSRARFAAHHADQRTALLKQRVGIIHFETHQGAKLGRGDAADDVLVGDPEPAHILLGEVYAALGDVQTDILPRVGQLKPGTDQVGETEMLFTLLAAGVKYQPPTGLAE